MYVTMFFDIISDKRMPPPYSKNDKVAFFLLTKFSLKKVTLLFWMRGGIVKKTRFFLTNFKLI